MGHVFAFGSHSLLSPPRSSFSPGRETVVQYLTSVRLVHGVLPTAQLGNTERGFDFEALHDRRDTGALKWDKFGERDVVPMWVADMELQTAPAVREALQTRIEHGIFGYTIPPPMVIDAVMRYYKASVAA